MALVQLLAKATQTDEPSDRLSEPPGVLLGIEEPEVFQHPLQARHLSKTLAALSRPGTAPIQVVYATHSEYFVDPTRFHSIRRMTKVSGSRGIEVSRTTAATVAGVSSRLAGLIPDAEVDMRVRVAMRRQLAEAVFARGVLIVEGATDAAFLHGLADRSGGFDAVGIAVVDVGGKTRLLLPWAIMEALGIPTYVVFDGDGGIYDRLIRNGRAEDEARQEKARTGRINRQTLAALGGPDVEFPKTTVERQYAVFKDELETEYAAWTDFTKTLANLRATTQDPREKSDDLYRQAAQSAKGPLPEPWLSLSNAMLGLLPGYEP
jgi:predicted ATP-dependent endonuclease of OLD family